MSGINETRTESDLDTLKRSIQEKRPDLEFVWSQGFCQTTTSVTDPRCPSVISSVRTALGDCQVLSKSHPQNIWRRTRLRPKRCLIGLSLSIKLEMSGFVRRVIPIGSHTAYEIIGWPWLRSSLYALVASVRGLPPQIFRPSNSGEPDRPGFLPRQGHPRPDEGLRSIFGPSLSLGSQGGTRAFRKRRVY